MICRQATFVSYSQVTPEVCSRPRTWVCVFVCVACMYACMDACMHSCMCVPPLSTDRYADAALSEFGGLPPAVLSPAHVREICRFGAAELHTEAAFVGGAVAQCVTILVSRQFKPVEGALLRNGINGATRVLEMVD